MRLGAILAKNSIVLLVGLGNPGPTHIRQRHNIGFMVIDEIARRLNFPNFRAKFNGEFSEANIDGQKVMLLKPQTFMNRSGISVSELVNFYKIQGQNIIVFHDELDLVAGKLRMQFAGGLAGHNGLRSMKEHMGGDFHRARLGIGHPGQKELVTGHVLGNFAPQDDWLQPFLETTSKNIELLLQGEHAKYQNRVALDMQPWLSKAKQTDEDTKNKTDLKTNLANTLNSTKEDKE